MGKRTTMIELMSRASAFLLAVVIAVGLMPLPAYAEGENIAVHMLTNGEPLGLIYASGDDVSTYTAAGWQDNGVAWYSPASSERPAYQVYNSVTGYRHYTLDSYEKDDLVSAGWTYEHVAFYGAANGSVPVYRLYHTGSGVHYYTSSLDVSSSMVSAGWRQEGLGLYAAAVGEALAPPDSLTKTPITGATVSTQESSYPYTGSAIEPAVTVTLNDTELPASAYDVAYSANVEPGTVTVTITGKGDYAGTATGQFVISKANISSATVSTDKSSYPYAGQAVEPAVTVELSGTVLPSDAYDVAYTGNTGPGTATVTVTGKGNYEGTASASFEIYQTKSLWQSSVSIPSSRGSYYPVYAWNNGDPVVLDDVVVTHPDDGVLQLGEDYELVFTVYRGQGSNLLDSITDEGVYRVYAQGINGYSGRTSNSATNVFCVAKPNHDISLAEVTMASTYIYDNGASMEDVLAPVVTLGNTELERGVDYRLWYSKGGWDGSGSLGEHTVWLFGLGDSSGSYFGEKQLSYTVVAPKTDISSATVSTDKSAYPYTGQAIEPAVTVTLGGSALAASAYDVSYSDNTGPGTATVTVTGKGDYEGSASATFAVYEVEKSGAADDKAAVGADYSGLDVALAADESKLQLEVADATATATDDAKAQRVAGVGDGDFRVFDVTLEAVKADGTVARTLDGEAGNEFGTLALTFDLGAQAKGKLATVKQIHGSGASARVIDRGSQTVPASGRITVSGVDKLSEFAISTQDQYTVTFDSDGGSAVAAATVTSGQAVARPANPAKSGYAFKEWQLNGAAYDFSAAVTGDITLKAAWTKNAAETITMYRLYNPWSGEHLFTKDKGEYDKLGPIGWRQEGEAWKSPTSGTPVYRLYNQYSGDHHYTTSASEYADLGRIGWTQEGVAFYSGGSRAVYRGFNPYETVGTHHYTTEKGEMDTMVSNGWRAEGVGWYCN